MTLGELKEYFWNLDQSKEIKYRLSQPFSWRGSYADVAFSIEEKPSYPHDSFGAIGSALTDTFEGYKGGIYKYTENTTVNFEKGPSDYSDGTYLTKIALKLLFE